MALNVLDRFRLAYRIKMATIHKNSILLRPVNEVNTLAIHFARF